MPDCKLRHPEATNLAQDGDSRLDDQRLGRGHLSHSALTTFLRCQQQFELHYERRLEPVVTARPLALGRAFATALEHTDPQAGETLLRADAAQEAKRAGNNPWITLPPQEEIDVQATIVGAAAKAYLHAYGHRDQTREVELRARIRNPRVGGRYSLTHDLVGRVDALSDDGATIYEDKLVGQVDQRSLAQRVRLDRQVLIGAYLTWRCTGVAPEQVRYRVTRKPQIRMRKDETHTLFLARIKADYEDRPEHYLFEEVARPTVEDFLRLEQEMWEWTEQVRQARRSGVWPRNTGECYAYGGCRFLSICSGEPGAEHQYREREQAANGAAAPTEFVEKRTEEAA